MIKLSGAAIQRLVPMTVAIDAVRQAFEGVAAGRFDQPTRIGLQDGRALVMLAGARDAPGVVVKSISSVPDNASRGLPTILATVLWMGEPTGQLSAILDGTVVTALRTGAASGVATALLATPNSRVLAMIGAGAQAPHQVAAVCAVRPIEEVRIWSRSAASRDRLTVLLQQQLPLHIRSESEIEAAVDGADVVCTATRSTEPIVFGSYLSAHAHINAVGAFRPDMAEIAPDVFAQAAVVAIDERDAAMAEAGDILRALREDRSLGGRLRLIGALTATSGWRRPDGVSVFKSVGIAAQDWALARAAYTAATADMAGEKGGLGI